MCVPPEFLKLFALHPTCRAPTVMRKYTTDNEAYECDVDVLQAMFFWDAMQRMRHRKKLHPSLLSLYGPLESKYHSFAFFSHKLMEHLQELFISSGSSDEFVDFVNENCLNSVNLYRECVHIQEDVGCFQTEDGTSVYNFRDPDCFHKWKADKMSQVNKVDATLPDLQGTEPKRQDRIPRKVSNSPCTMNLSIRSHKVGYVDDSLFSKIKDSIPDSDYQEVTSLFNSRYLKMHHKVWKYRNKCYALLMDFLDTNIMGSSHQVSIMHRVRDTALLEFESVIHAVFGACRLLKAVRLPVV